LGTSCFVMAMSIESHRKARGSILKAWVGGKRDYVS